MLILLHQVSLNNVSYNLQLENVLMKICLNSDEKMQIIDVYH